MEILLRDIRYGVRMILRHPGSSAMAVVALALGIGLVAAMTSVVDAVLFAELPFRNVDRICVPQWEAAPGSKRFTGTRAHEFVDWGEQQKSFDLFGAARIGQATISRDDIFATTLQSMSATTAVFEMAGVLPARGRPFNDDDMKLGAAPVVLISETTWKATFQSDPDIVGKTLRIDGKTATIIGVMPAGWEFPFQQQIWQPLILDMTKETRGSADPVILFGRLAAGVSRASAKLELDAIAARIAEAYPDSHKEYTSVDVLPVDEWVFGRTTRILLWTMLAAVLLVLVVACANVANIILGRSALRLHELAVRTALGATRARLITQMLTETFVLALAGAGAGFVFAHFALEYLWNMLPNDGMPFWFATGFQPYYFLVVLGISVVATVLSGLMPALKSSGVTVRDALQDSTRTASGFSVGRISRILVGLQVALCCGLLIASLCMIRMTSALTRVPFPFDPDKVLTARLVASDEQASGETKVEDYLALERLRESLEANPALRGVGFTTAYALLYPWRSRFRIEGEEYVTQDDAHYAYNEVVSESYFHALGLLLVKGRLFEPTDTRDTERVVVVNTKFAEARWPGQDPIGKRFKDIWKDEIPWVRVVGVVTHMGRGDNIPGDDGGCVYQYMRQAPQGASTVVIRSDGDPKQLVGFLRDTVRKELPGMSIDEIYTLQESADRSASGLVFLTSLFSSFGVAAILLASVGLYGVVSASVAQRGMEIGIRVALGATRGRIISMVVQQSLIQVGTGIVVGLLLGWGLNKVLFLAFQLPGTLPTATSFVYVPAVLIGVALLAVAVPSLRASRVSPMAAIRAE